MSLANLELSSLPKEQREALLKEISKEMSGRLIEQYYPETGPLRRELYPKHLQFFTAGGAHKRLPTCAKDCDGEPHRERLMLAANRIGKTETVGGYEVVRHATGDYPDWWPGRTYDRPVKIWVAGDTSNTVRDILQMKLLGQVGDFGTGLIPRRCIDRVTWKRNVPEAVQDCYIKHSSGGRTLLTLKSYDQGRESFQGTEQDIIWLDEEPPIAIYAECLLRTMTTGGMVLCTFTPLLGLSDVVLSFLPGGKLPVSSTAAED